MKKNLIDEYIETLKKTKLEQDDYANKLSVMQANRASKKLRKIASNIDSSSLELKEDFLNLLDIEEDGLDRYVAHHILELMNYDIKAQQRAILILEDVARGDELVESFGTQRWLIDWYRKHPDFEAKEDIIRKHEEKLQEGRSMMKKIAEINNKRMINNSTK